MKKKKSILRRLLFPILIFLVGLGYSGYNLYEAVLVFEENTIQDGQSLTLSADNYSVFYKLPSDSTFNDEELEEYLKNFVVSVKDSEGNEVQLSNKIGIMTIATSKSEYVSYFDFMIEEDSTYQFTLTSPIGVSEDFLVSEDGNNIIPAILVFIFTTFISIVLALLLFFLPKLLTFIIKKASKPK